MRIAVVSDIHGNLPALRAVLEDIRHRGADLIVNLGDSLSGPLLARDTAQFLMAQDWPQLAGNHERQLAAADPALRTPSDHAARAELSEAEMAWFALLPKTLELDGDIFACHGTPGSDCEYFLETVEPTGVRLASAAEIDSRLGAVRASLVLCGHTHFPRALRKARGQLIVNPGSVGLPAYDDDQPYHHLIETGSPDARYALVECRSGRWSAALMTASYDHESMAKLAAQRKRLDWAVALATGYTTCSHSGSAR